MAMDGHKKYGMLKRDPYSGFVKNSIGRGAARSVQTPPSQSGGVVIPHPSSGQSAVQEEIRGYPLAPEKDRVYDLMKHYTPGPNDTCFDLQAWYLVPNPLVPTAGNQVVIYQNQFPQGRDFILTRYNFGIALNDTPVFQHLVMATPCEFVGVFDFVITADDQLPFDMSYVSSGAAVFNREGLPILTENPEEAGTPIHGGFHVRIKGGQTLRVIFRNYTYAFGQPFPSNRRIYGVGARLRGFYSTSDPAKEKGVKT